MYQLYRQSFRKHVATLLNLCGYDTEIRKIMIGHSGMKHKIDIVARKFEMPIEEVLLVKCKAKEENPSLRVDEVLILYVQVLDTIADHGLIVTTCEVPGDAAKFAEYYKMKIIQGANREELQSAIFRGRVKQSGRVSV
nr:restriction endonuclease [Candidatus Njordarchaeum guaymaensis]